MSSVERGHTGAARPHSVRRLVGRPAAALRRERGASAATDVDERSGPGRGFYLLVGGFFVSSAGDWLYQLALPLLVFQITHSPMSMAVTYALTYLPYVLFLPLGGVLADRVDRRRLLVIGDLGSAALAAALAAALWLGQPSMWLIYPAVLLLASITPLYHPAFQSLVPGLVAGHDLTRANAWLNGAESAVSLVGPIVGGIVIAAFGTTSALVIDALSFLLSALMLLSVRLRRAAEPVASGQEAERPAASWLADLREGAAFIGASPIIAFGALIFLATNFAVGVVQANYIYFLSETVALPPAGVGLAFAIVGLGSLVGALLAPALERRFGPGMLIVACTFGSGVAALPLILARDVVSAALPWAVVTALGTVTAVTWFTLRQRVVPPALLGRVIALTRLIAFAAIPVAAIVGGALLTATGSMSLLIVLAAAICLVVGGLAALTPIARA